MAIFSSVLTSASDRSATFLTVLAGRTVKIGAVREVPGSNPDGPHQKLHRSIRVNEKKTTYIYTGPNKDPDTRAFRFRTFNLNRSWILSQLSYERVLYIKSFV